MKSLTSRLRLVLPLLASGLAANIASAQPDDATGVTFTTLHSFCLQSGCPDGTEVQAGLIQTTTGDLYGTTYLGGDTSGDTNCAPSGCGTIFKITPSGALTTVYSFHCLGPCSAFPTAGLIQAANGELYGTTAEGARSSGSIFRMNPGGAPAIVYSFGLQAGDGEGPDAAMIQTANGNLYGTTYDGGSGAYGTVFKITPGGTLTTLYSFCYQTSCAGGANPSVGLIQAANGDIYGTSLGGIYSASCLLGCGTVFKITPAGMLTTLYSFCSQAGCTDGQGPSSLVQAGNGDLYGTTAAGGIANVSCTYGGCGTIFKITSTGTLTTVYSFCSNGGACTDGFAPLGGLVQAASGNLYGTTAAGGAHDHGTIFKITPSGALSTLYSFCAQAECPDGFNPGALVQATNGIFYGTTNNGGASANCDGGCGTIFALSTGQAPFVETRPTIGVVGEVVTILGYKLTGTTSVTFNGIPAAFTVDAATAITTTVPTARPQARSR